MPTAPAREYEIAWEPDTTTFSQGDEAPIQWLVSDRLGQLVSFSTVTLSILRPDGVTDSPSCYGAGGSPSTPVVCGAVYTIPAVAGVYVATLHVSDGATPPQIRSARQDFTVI